MMFIWQAGAVLLFVEAIVVVLTVGAIGFFHTFLLWLASVMIGGWLVRRQGMETLSKLFSGGAVQAEHLYDSLCLLIAGLLFIFPGFVSDAIAFALVIPMVRNTFRARGVNFFTRHAPARPAQRGDDSVIEGSYKVVEEEPQKIAPKPPAS